MPSGYFLRCFCGEPIFLPTPNPPTAVENPYYWPTAEGALVFICRECRNASIFHQSDVEQGPIPPAPPTGSPFVAFWRVEVICGEIDCGFRASVYTRAESDQPPEGIIAILQGAETRVACARGHDWLVTENTTFSPAIVG